MQCFFDPLCPWAYRTSLWLREVRRQRPLEITWRFFSLEEINREPGKPHPWERAWSYGWSQLRVAALLRRRGQDLLDRWYAEAGASIFERGELPFTPDGARQVLVGLGLAPGLVDEALADPSTDEEVLADHRWLVERYGGHGVPTLVFDDGPQGQALFGPVVLEVPRGDAALRLWDLVETWLEVPGLYELRRPKTATDVAAIESAFAPYLRARAWRSVQTPAP